MSLAVVVIASEKRRETTFPRCLDSVRDQAPDEIVVVADFPCEAKGVRSLRVEPMLRNTIDALVKRDVGWMATTSNEILYLCDDHILEEHFVEVYRAFYESDDQWDILVPSRFCWRDLDGRAHLQWLNVGKDQGYAGGHAAIYKRACGHVVPWSSTRHHPNWDVLHSLDLKDRGFTLAYAGQSLAVEDIEGGTPWL